VALFTVHDNVKPSESNEVTDALAISALVAVSTIVTIASFLIIELATVISPLASWRLPLIAESSVPSLKP